MKHIAIIVCFFVATLHGVAQRGPDVVADAVQFRGAGTNVMWEFHYSFPDTTLKFVLAPTGFIAEMRCSVTVKHDTAEVAFDEWIAEARSTVGAPPVVRQYSGIRRFNLTPGSYSVHFTAQDMHNPERTLSTTIPVTIIGVSSRPAMSDIMFVMPKGASSNTSFVRAGQPCEPNPRHEVVGAEPRLGFYIEFYNAKLSALDTSYAAVTVFNNVRDEEFTSFIPIIGTSNDLAIREELPVELLTSGVYTLRVQFVGKDRTTVYDSREEKFYVLNPEQIPQQRKMVSEDEDFQASEWAATTGDRLKLELELCEVLATPAEIQTAKLCTDERSKQRFLYRFWKSRDTDESTSANERLDEFRANYKHAQNFYRSVMYTDGWKSDRGRVILKYGRPTQIKQFMTTKSHKSIEIWIYQHIQGGTYFCFVDVNQQQEYKIVHSTVIGWVYEMNWYNLYAKLRNPFDSGDEDINPEILPYTTNTDYQQYKNTPFMKSR